MKAHLPLIKMHPFVLLLALFLISMMGLNAQNTRKVLFLGNSYTGVNNLPKIIFDAASSVGDSLVFDSYTPGGYQLISHSNDAVSQSKIMAGGWDYVVLQGQSQEPITNTSQFNSGGSALYNLIKQHNSCAVVMPYMTWGRKNGDASNCASFPVMCTYQGMDTSIRNKYLSFTAFVNGEVSPVSVVWNYLRKNNPTLELYQSDESHPSVAGSFAAACCFYTSIFKKDPTFISYNPGLSNPEFIAIKNAVKTQVYDNLSAWDFKKLPTSNFGYSIGSGLNQVIFNPISKNVKQTYFWNFGDSTSSALSNPTHSYIANGTYKVRLTTQNCDFNGLYTSFLDTIIQFCNHTPSVFTSKAWLCKADTLWTQAADSYQWFNYGAPLPETRQFLPNFTQYNISGFSVLTTDNGCSELSQQFSKSPIWPGYYFDVLGSPCLGDTVKFTVLHINGFLSGSENIQWLKNGILLPFSTNKDTLFITSEGKYEVKVVNPNSNCPLDTTTYSIVYTCGATGIKENSAEFRWSVYPNPASENITISFAKSPINAQIQIFSAIGVLTKTISGLETTHVNIADLPTGLYFIRLKNSSYPALKFIKN